MTNKPYNITSEHFSRARADIARRRKELDTELARVDADEWAVAHIAERYLEDAASPAPKVGRKTRARKTVNADGSPRLPNAGRPYKRKDDARIEAAERGKLEELAREMGRPYPGVLKRHEILVKQRKRGKTGTAPDPARTHRLHYNTGPGTPFRAPETEKGPDTVDLIEKPAPEKPGSENSPDAQIDKALLFEPLRALDEELDRLEPSSSEKPEIVEPSVPAHIDADYGACPTDPVRIESTKPPAPSPARPADLASAARELAEFDARRQRMPRAKPGIPVRGLTNDGPGHERFIDPVAFASRRPD